MHKIYRYTATWESVLKIKYENKLYLCAVRTKPECLWILTFYRHFTCWFSATILTGPLLFCFRCIISPNPMGNYSMLSSVQTEWHLSGKNHTATSNKLSDVNTHTGSLSMPWIALLRTCTVNKSCIDLQSLNLSLERSRSHSAQESRWSRTIKSIQPWTQGKECYRPLSCLTFTALVLILPRHTGPTNLRPLFIL